MTDGNDEKPTKSGRTQDGRFAPGVSGNPSGPQKGYRHKVSRMMEKLMQDDAEAVIKAVIAGAKSGDTAAARMVVDRLAPARKSATIELELPEINTPADAVRASAQVLAALADGVIGADEADALNSGIAAVVRTIESADIDARLRAIEEQLSLGKR